MPTRKQKLINLFDHVDEDLGEEDVLAFQDDLCRLGEMDHPTYVDYLARRDQTVYGQAMKAVRLFLFDLADEIIGFGDYRKVADIEDLIAVCHRNALHRLVVDQMWLIKTHDDRDFFLKTLVLINFLRNLSMEAGWIITDNIKHCFQITQTTPRHLLFANRQLFTDKVLDFFTTELEDWDPEIET